MMLCSCTQFVWKGDIFFQAAYVSAVFGLGLRCWMSILVHVEDCASFPTRWKWYSSVLWKSMFSYWTFFISFIQHAGFYYTVPNVFYLVTRYILFNCIMYKFAVNFVVFISSCCLLCVFCSGHSLGFWECKNQLRQSFLLWMVCLT